MTPTSNSRIFRHLLPHFKAQRRLFVLGILALLATNLVQQCIPLLLKYAIDGLQSKAAITVVLLWAGLRFGAVAAQGVLRYGWRMGFFGMGRHVEYGMRRQLFDKLMSLPLAYYLRNKTGDLLSRAMSDLATVRESLGFGWLTTFDSISTIALTIVFMRHLDPGLTFWCLLPLSVLPVLVATLGRKVRQGTREAQAALDDLSQAATESFRGARVIQAYAREPEENGRFSAVSRAYRDKNMAIVRLEALYWPLLSVISGVAKLMLIYMGGTKVALAMRGDALNGMTLGSFVAMYEYLLQIIWPVLALGFSTNIFVRGKVSVERLNEVYDAESEIVDGPGTAAVIHGAPVLTLRDIGFVYPASQVRVLDGLNLSLKKGEWLGLAGRTGSGKSTLLRLPARLIDPSQGQVEIEGLDVREWRLEKLRAYSSLVTQEPFLFSESILDNIAFGAEHPDLEMVKRCARVADLADFVESLPQAYGSMLGEKGVNLSGGQKQRLALARSLYMRPRLLLLDDAFSAVDTGTEERIVAGLREALPETAVLLVSHRVSTLGLCDRVLVLDQGRITEEGIHSELMQKEGFYFGMARRESLARQAGLALE